MSCFPCFQNKNEEEEIKEGDLPVAQPKDFTPPPPQSVQNNTASSTQAAQAADSNKAADSDSGVQTFTFRELATATKNFRQECLLVEGGIGRLFKGTLTPSGQVVAVRQLDRSGAQDSKEFLAQVSTLTELDHPNLIKMIGCCADGEQRLLVYEYMPPSSLKGHLFDLSAGDQPLDWSKRMKIALGIATGLEYLHEKVNPPIIYRDLKSSSILLDEANQPKLAEYGLVRLVQSGSKMHGGFGYSAPEYERNGELTEKSDVYSFGVVLLELVTGRKALDTDCPLEEQNLVSWAQPLFKDQSQFSEMADPLLRKGFPITSLNQAIGVAAMCLQDEPCARPLISDISAALSFLAMAPPEAPIPARLVSILSTKVDTASQFGDSDSIKKSEISGNSSGNSKSDTSDDDDDDDDDDDGNDDGLDKCYSGGDKSCSDYEYGDSSDSSDGGPASENRALKSGKSKKLNSSSKRKSKKKQQSISKSSKSNRTSSLRSSPSSTGFSLRCDSTFPDRLNDSDDISSVGSDREEHPNNLGSIPEKKSHSRSGSKKTSNEQEGLQHL